MNGLIDRNHRELADFSIIGGSLAWPSGDAAVTNYRSMSDLVELLECLEEFPEPWRLTVVLGLDDGFRGDLLRLIRRESPALRLILVTASGRLPAGLSAGDLAIAACRLGWGAVDFRRDLDWVVARGVKQVVPGEAQAVIWPKSQASLLGAGSSVPTR